jgi:hypothetical protein
MNSLISTDSVKFRPLALFFCSEHDFARREVDFVGVWGILGLGLVGRVRSCERLGRDSFESLFD